MICKLPTPRKAADDANLFPRTVSICHKRLGSKILNLSFRVSFKVIPKYQHHWIQGIAVSGNATAPGKI